MAKVTLELFKFDSSQLLGGYSFQNQEPSNYG